MAYNTNSNNQNNSPSAPLEEKKVHTTGTNKDQDPVSEPGLEDSPMLLGIGLTPTQVNPFRITAEGNNLIERDIYSIHYDQKDLEELGPDTIFELLPKPLDLPDEPPLSAEVYAANWSRIYDFGGVTDESKDPSPEYLTDWAEIDFNADPPAISGIGAWVERHMWPAKFTLNPTYIFYTGDPGVFYTQNATSYIDEKGIYKEVENNDIVWKLNGEEVHRGWHLSLGSLSRTVDIFPSAEPGGDPIVIPKPQLLDIEFHNKAGMIKKQIKYVALDSDDANLLGGGYSTIDNFTSTFEGSFKVTNPTGTNQADDLTEKGIEFVKEPKFGPRRLWFRFVWKQYGEGKSRKRDFKNADAFFDVDGVRQFHGKAEDICGRHKTRREAKPYFPELYNENNNIRSKYKSGDKGVTDLTSRMVHDMTDGRKSALIYDEKDDGNYYNQLFFVEKKPGPFKIYIYTWIKVRSGGKKRRTYEKTISFVNNEFNPDTAFDNASKTCKDIDLGVFEIGYEDRKW